MKLPPRAPILPVAWTLLAAAFVSLVGCGDLVQRRSEGEKLYRKHCASCHGVDGGGQTIRYMGNPNADLTDGHWKHGGDSVAIQETIRQGVVELHPSSLRRLDNQQIKEVANWVLHLRGESSR